MGVSKEESPCVSELGARRPEGQIFPAYRFDETTPGKGTNVFTRGPTQRTEFTVPVRKPRLLRNFANDTLLSIRRIDEVGFGFSANISAASTTVSINAHK